VIEPIDRRGRLGILDGHDVRLETPSGEIVSERPDARSYFRRVRRRYLYWDTLDLTYFVGYAVWNYLTLPALLLRDDVEWREVAEGVLEAAFPPELPTHGRRQRHTFDRETGLLVRYDYNPEVVVGGGDVVVANVVLERGEFEGIPYEARRKVVPSDDETGEPRARPVFIEMRFWDWRLD
jgi:hypothetical protein